MKTPEEMFLEDRNKHPGKEIWLVNWLEIDWRPLGISLYSFYKQQKWASWSCFPINFSCKQYRVLPFVNIWSAMQKNWPHFHGFNPLYRLYYLLLSTVVPNRPSLPIRGDRWFTTLNDWGCKDDSIKRVILKTLSSRILMKLETFPLSKKNLGIILITDMPNS